MQKKKGGYTRGDRFGSDPIRATNTAPAISTESTSSSAAKAWAPGRAIIKAALDLDKICECIVSISALVLTISQYPAWKRATSRTLCACRKAVS
jgi:hypothetical protein